MSLVFFTSFTRVVLESHNGQLQLGYGYAGCQYPRLIVHKGMLLDLRMPFLGMS